MAGSQLLVRRNNFENVSFPSWKKMKFELIYKDLSEPAFSKNTPEVGVCVDVFKDVC